MKWDDITHGQLERMEAQSMEKSKRRELSPFEVKVSIICLILIGLLVIVLVFLIPFALWDLAHNGPIQSPCHEMFNWPISRIPARCLAEMMAHG